MNKAPLTNDKGIATKIKQSKGFSDVATNILEKVLDKEGTSQTIGTRAQSLSAQVLIQVIQTLFHLSICCTNVWLAMKGPVKLPWAAELGAEDTLDGGRVITLEFPKAADSLVEYRNVLSYTLIVPLIAILT
jgi:hypothetical protein